MKKKLLNLLALMALCGSAQAQTDVTERYIKNPGFEGEYTVFIEPKSDRCIYGPNDWSVKRTDGDENDLSCITASDKQANDNFGKFTMIDPSTRGYHTYWTRLRWGTNTALSLSQDPYIPTGRYKLSADFLSYASGSTEKMNTILFAGSKQAKDAYSTTKSDAAGWNNVVLVFDQTTASELSIGYTVSRSAAVEQIVGADNFKLEAYNPAELDDDGITVGYGSDNFPLPESAVITGYWYTVAEVFTGKYTITADVATTITYTQDGTQATTSSELSSLTFTAGETKEVDLTSGKLYLKADDDATITIKPTSFTYIVGRSTNNLEGKYAQQGQTFTITFPSATTNDPDATFALSGDTKVLLNSVEQTISLSGNTLSVTLEGTLAAATAYTLTIPAGTVGYAAGSIYNEEISISFNSPTVLDSIYYLYNPTAKGFIGRGSSYGTRAVIDGNGIPAQFTTDAAGKTTLKFIDNGGNLGDDGNCYTDVDGNRIRTFQISADAEGYSLMNTNTNNNKYLCAADGAVVANSESADLWKICTLAERNAIVAQLALEDKIALAKKLGQDITTEAEFTNLLNNYVTVNKTDAIKNPALTNLEGWDKTEVKNSNMTWSAVNTGTYGTELFQIAGSLTQTVKELEEGVYKVELYGFCRQGSNANCAKYKDYPLSSAYLQANSYKVHLNSWASQRTSDTNPNNTTEVTSAFNEGSYLNTLYTYVGDDGQLDLTIDNPGILSSGWTIVYGLKLYKLSEKASDGEIAALQTEISKAEAIPIGFEDSEYAPYNNAAAITALAAAKEALTLASKVDVTAATEAMKAATWTINEGEVNAVYNGDFAKCKNNGAMQGWTMSNNTLGGDYHSRAFVGDSRLAEFNGTKSGAFLRFDGTNSSRGSLYYYGDTEGYTMPLKAHTVYCLSADVKGWGSTGKPIRLNISGPTGFTTQYAQVTTTNKADTDGAAPQQLQIIFYTGEHAGNYTISFQTPGDGNEHNVVVSNISLKKLPAEDITVSFKQEYGTLILPFAAEVQTGMEVYSVNSYAEGSSNVLQLVSKDKIEANTPYIVKKTTEAEANFTFNGVVYITDKTYEDGLLVGVLEATAAPVNSYVLQKQGDLLGFYQVVAGTDITVPAYRAYLKNTEATANIQAFFFDDNDPTSATTAKTAAGTVDVYSINGILVRKDAQASQALDGLPKGLYIVNGKTQVVK